jgi:hypothetical protein
MRIPNIPCKKLTWESIIFHPSLIGFYSQVKVYHIMQDTDIRVEDPHFSNKRLLWFGEPKKLSISCYLRRKKIECYGHDYRYLFCEFILKERKRWTIKKKITSKITKKIKSIFTRVLKYIFFIFFFLFFFLYMFLLSP